MQHRLADSLEHLWVQHARERVGGACEPRAGGDEVPAVQQVHAAVAHRGHRGEQLPDRTLFLERLSGRRIAWIALSPNASQPPREDSSTGGSAWSH